MATTEQTLIMMKTVFRRSGKEKTSVDFDELFNEHVKPLYAFVTYRVGNRAAAEDITAQVFEKAWSSLGNYDPDKGSFSSWLYTIARNCVVDHFRRQQRNQESVLHDDMGGGSSQNPQHHLEEKELRRELGMALGSLDEREREVIAMKFGGSMSNKDIAAVLELTPTNVSTILYRSLDKLNTQLEGGI
jgi:RNA polymerase sigma-70 factor (ECF subfamily)